MVIILLNAANNKSKQVVRFVGPLVGHGSSSFKIKRFHPCHISSGRCRKSFLHNFIYLFCIWFLSCNQATCLNQPLLYSVVNVIHLCLVLILVSCSLSICQLQNESAPLLLCSVAPINCGCVHFIFT